MAVSGGQSKKVCRDLTAPPMREGGIMDTENTPVAIMTVNRGDTTYIVEHVISTSARETAYEKVKKLILNDMQFTENRKAS